MPSPRRLRKPGAARKSRGTRNAVERLLSMHKFNINRWAMLVIKVQGGEGGVLSKWSRY
jgi:hypothetical protein